MPDRVQDILQRIYNEIDTAETYWLRYKAALIPPCI